jgi:hypothetical protein
VSAALECESSITKFLCEPMVAAANQDQPFACGLTGPLDRRHAVDMSCVWVSPHSAKSKTMNSRLSAPRPPQPLCGSFCSADSGAAALLAGIEADAAADFCSRCELACQAGLDERLATTPSTVRCAPLLSSRPAQSLKAGAEPAEAPRPRNAGAGLQVDVCSQQRAAASSGHARLSANPWGCPGCGAANGKDALWSMAAGKKDLLYPFISPAGTPYVARSSPLRPDLNLALSGSE